MAAGIFKLLHSVTFYALLTGFVTRKAYDDLEYRATGVVERAIGREMAKCNLHSPAARRSTDSTKLSPSSRCLLLSHLTNDALLMNYLLLCGDVAMNPGLARTKATCGTCLKTFQKNQGFAHCSSCTIVHHLKCLGANFELDQICKPCSVPAPASSRASDGSLHLPPNLASALKPRMSAVFTRKWTSFVSCCVIVLAFMLLL